jgi:hypothetical protein
MLAGRLHRDAQQQAVSRESHHVAPACSFLFTCSLTWCYLSHRCLVLRFITTATVEEKVLTTATTKLSHEQMVIQAGMFHEKYSHNASRAIAAEAMEKEKRAGEDDTGDDDEAHGTDDFISRTLARSDAELAVFQQMDIDAKAHEQAANITRGLPEGKMPKWCFDWCLHGPNATSIDQTLVPFSEKVLDAARAKINKTTEENGVLKARKAYTAIVEVNTSDDDDKYDTQAESSGVNDAALDEEQEKPLDYDNLDDEPITPAANLYGTPAAKKPAKKRPAASEKGAKRKRDDSSPAVHSGLDGGASPASTPAPKKPRAKKDPSEKKPRASTKKKTAPAASSASAMETEYQPLSYSDAENDTEMLDYSAGPTLQPTATGGMKLVLNRNNNTPSAASPSPAPGNTFKLSIPRPQT